MTRSVSIVLPHYGDPTPTQRLVGQLTAQAGDVDVQIIVSDDASPEPFPDGTAYQTVRSDINRGFGSTVNAGAAHARHERLLILNSDVTVDRDFLTDLLEGAQAWWPAVVAPRVRQGDGTLCVARRWPTVSQQVVEWLEPLARFHGRDWLENAIGNDVAGWHAEAPVRVDWATGVCLLVPTTDFAAVGGFDENFYMNCEEIDLQRRLHDERGLQVMLLPAPTIDHVGGGSSNPGRRAGWLTDARMRYHNKWSGGPALGLGLLAATGVNFGWGCLRQLWHRDVRPIPHARSQLGLISHAWRNRL